MQWLLWGAGAMTRRATLGTMMLFFDLFQVQKLSLCVHILHILHGYHTSVEN